MAEFILGRFTEGTVRADGWWAPRDGQQVMLHADNYGLLIHDDETGDYHPGDVFYTWPRRCTHQKASLLAWRHFDQTKRAIGRGASAPAKTHQGEKP